MGLGKAQFQISGNDKVLRPNMTLTWNSNLMLQLLRTNGDGYSMRVLMLYCWSYDICTTSDAKVHPSRRVSTSPSVNEPSCRIRPSSLWPYPASFNRIHWKLMKLMKLCNMSFTISVLLVQNCLSQHFYNFCKRLKYVYGAQLGSLAPLKNLVSIHFILEHLSKGAACHRTSRHLPYFAIICPILAQFWNIVSTFKVGWYKWSHFPLTHHQGIPFQVRPVPDSLHEVPLSSSVLRRKPRSHQPALSIRSIKFHHYEIL